MRGIRSSITTVEPIAAKFEAFGWDAYDVDGHDVDALAAALASAGNGDRPSVVMVCPNETISRSSSARTSFGAAIAAEGERSNAPASCASAPCA